MPFSRSLVNVEINGVFVWLFSRFGRTKGVFSRTNLYVEVGRFGPQVRLFTESLKGLTKVHEVDILVEKRTRGPNAETRSWNIF